MKREVDFRELLITVCAVLLAGAAPNLFVIAQAGYAPLKDLLSSLTCSAGVTTS
jgi:hypothetical protein